MSRAARITLSDLSPRHQAEVLGQLERGKQSKSATIKLERADKPRLRQSSKGLNKTEADFLYYLRCTYQIGSAFYAYVHREVSLPLGNGVRYKVDFVVADLGTGKLTVTAYEVKGFMRDDAAVKLKVAASQYPWMRFVLVSRSRGTLTRWDMQEVQP